MPLKHATETLLVFVLGIALALTGFVIAVLPPLPSGMVWWVGALALSLAYPLSVYPLLKSRRADYPFRTLHFAPFLLLLIRFALDVGSTFLPALREGAAWYSWGWAAAAVFVVFLFLMIFCIRVLRQRDTRLLLLTALFLPFLFLGLFTEWTGWNERIASVLSGSTLLADNGPVSQSGANVEPSEDALEERWRAMLRWREGRRQSLESTTGLPGVASSIVLAVPGSSAASYASSRSSSASLSSSASSTPPHLVSAGPNVGLLVLLAAAAYCGILHQRARKRRA